MDTFIVYFLNGEVKAITEKEFFVALNSNEYRYLADKDPISESKTHYLFHKDNEKAVEVYTALHNSESNEWGHIDRLTRCELENGTLCKKPKKCCEACERERSARCHSLEEREENGVPTIARNNVQTEYELKEMTQTLRETVKFLCDEEKDIIVKLFLQSEPLTMAEYAHINQISYSTARSLRDRAFRHIISIAPQLKDYL